jgi:phage shock protein PspC (stress-responsive transcriptional regulator)
MNQPFCSRTIQNLLESTDSPGEDVLLHVRDCENCRKLVERAAELESLLTENGGNEVAEEGNLFEQTEQHAVELVTWKRTVRFFIETGLAGTIAIGAIFWAMVAGTYTDRTRPELLSDALPPLFLITTVVGFTLGLSIARLRSRTSPVVPPKWAAFVPPILVLMFVAEYRFAQFLARDHDSWFTWVVVLWMLTAAVAGYLPASAGLPYKRLRKGYMLSGICLGIAERTKVPVGVIRLAFLVLAFAKMSGVLLYVVLDLLMQVHPDDRATLLRFRLRRWWSGRVARRVAS